MVISSKPSINLNWDNLKKSGLIDGDFYLADLLSHENITLKDKLYVLLQSNHYELNRKLDDTGLFTLSTATFNDNQKAHNQFWNKYERPPKEEYWDYIVNRRDLLVPQDVRERKGSFFTPQIWVELSQKYLADALGENWQDEYYIWDCAAGTGNLLNGLTNKVNIWASTLDQQDVDVMKDRIKNGANLLEDHVFQFDFLNDDFSKLPKSLLEIINNEKKRQKLVIYINPPYAEAGSYGNKSKIGVSTNTQVYLKYNDLVGNAINELFIQFFTRVTLELDGCILAEFSKLKFIQGSNFEKFRNIFKSKYLRGFIVPALTFDNVKGKFPIGFFIFNTNSKLEFKDLSVQVIDKNNNFLGQKNIYTNDKKQGKINSWLKEYYDNNSNVIGIIHNNKNDFQTSKQVRITSFDNMDHTNFITINNIFQVSIYFAVRHNIEATWVNDNDQFLFPNKKWEKDIKFQTDCFTFTLFHSQNRITSNEGTNHWIPFNEYEVNARDNFDSNFMSNFIKGKETDFSSFTVNEPIELYGSKNKKLLPLEFSPEAKAVFDSGRKLWQYYHSKPKVNVNASLYDIREYFQGRNEKGKMNNKSTDEQYNLYIADLRNNLKLLAKVIEPKIYEYGFLKA